MIIDLDDEHFASLSAGCASQGTMIRITKAGIINLKSQIENLKSLWGCMVLTA